MKIDKSWTLFLDRDGVINRRIAGDYIKTWDQFEFLPGSLDALKILSAHFGRMIIVSNQQGIGKGMMTEEDLDLIHQKMISGIVQAGGRIDRIYHSPFLETENSHYRKPNTGMADQARIDFPQIDFNHSVMAGDSETDMHFGKRAQMTTVLIATDPEQGERARRLADYVFPDLMSFAKTITGTPGGQ